MSLRVVPVDLLVLSNKLQCRVSVPDGVIDEYVARWKDSELTFPFPPVTVVSVDGLLYVVDGFCRVQSAILAGVEKLECNVETGTWSHAIELACGANADHGLRRTNDDKHRAVEVALEHFGKYSDRKIAKIANVSHTFVALLRKNKNEHDAFSEPVKPKKLKPKEESPQEESIEDHAETQEQKSSKPICPECKKHVAAVLTDGGTACSLCLCPLDAKETHEEDEIQSGNVATEVVDAELLAKVKTRFGQLVRAIEDASLESVFASEVKAINEKLKGIK